MENLNTRNPYSAMDKSVWKDADLGRRLAFIRHEMFVPHPDMAKCIAHITNSNKSAKLERVGKSLFITAPSGSGKTTLVRSFKIAMPDVIEDEYSRLPVVNFDVPYTVNFKRMNEALLRALGDPVAQSKNENEPDKRALELLRLARTEIVLLDDTQDITERRRSRFTEAIGSWVRRFIDTSGLLLVLLGTAKAEAIMQINEQLGRRSTARASISFFNVYEAKGLKTLNSFLEAIDHRLPLAELSGLGEKGNQLTKQFAYATGGIQALIFQIIVEAVHRAVKEGREKLSLDDLAYGFDATFLDQSKGRNPFRNEIQRVLDRDGEPLHAMLAAAKWKLQDHTK